MQRQKSLAREEGRLKASLMGPAVPGRRPVSGGGEVGRECRDCARGPDGVPGPWVRGGGEARDGDRAHRVTGHSQGVKRALEGRRENVKAGAA